MTDQQQSEERERWECRNDVHRLTPAEQEIEDIRAEMEAADREEKRIARMEMESEDVD